MLERKQYSKPPLVEVFCEFFFEPQSNAEWDIFLLPQMHDKIRDRFPERKHLRTVGVHLNRDRAKGFQMERFGPATPRHQFISTDGKSLAQVGDNLLAVNQLPPYYGWDNFRPRVEECFAAYCDLWKPQRIACAALHYIDKIDIPLPQLNLFEYFNLYPTLPDDAPDSITSIAMGFESQGKMEGDIFAVAFRQEPSANPEHTSFVLQFDYVAGAGLELALEGVTGWLEAAHDACSSFFRSAITAKCAELFC